MKVEQKSLTRPRLNTICRDSVSQIWNAGKEKGHQFRWPSSINQSWLPHKRSYERAALVMQRPGNAQVFAAILIGHGDGRHGVSGLRERFVESVFVPAKVV